MAQKKATRVKDSASEIINDDDRISCLPDGVIHHIFSFVDTTSMVQSSLLSRRWRNTWKSHPHLNFKVEQTPSHTRGGRFPNFVHRYLSNRADIAEVLTIDFRSNSIRSPLLKEIIIYAMSHRTRNLNIEFSGERQSRRGEFDISIFRSQFVQHLCLNIAFRVIKSPILTWDMPALTTLNLEHVTFTPSLPNDGDSKCFELFSCFPKLKTISLADCRFLNIDTLLIMSSELENLTMVDLHQTCKLVISAPKLLSFTYYGMLRFPLSAKDLHSLETVNYYTIYPKSLEKQQELAELMINTFYQVSKAKFLCINSDALMFLLKFPDVLEKQPSPFTSLQNLTFVEHRPLPSSIVFDDAITYFRSSSPFLRVNIELGSGTPGIRYVYSH